MWQRLRDQDRRHTNANNQDSSYIEYIGLIPVMINAIKELSDRVKVLEGEHDS